MAEQARRNAPAVHLEPDGDRPFVFSTETKDRFLRTCEWAVEVCQLGIGRDVWFRELQALFGHVNAWATANAKFVRACFAAPRDDQIAIYVIPQAGRFDFKLSDLMTVLDFELSEKFQACPCDVLQVSPTFLEGVDGQPEDRRPVQVYGNEVTTQRPVAT